MTGIRLSLSPTSGYVSFVGRRGAKMKSHKEFTEEILELTREPTLPEKTKDALNVKKGDSE